MFIQFLYDPIIHYFSDIETNMQLHSIILPVVLEMKYLLVMLVHSVLQMLDREVTIYKEHYNEITFFLKCY